MSNKIKLLKHSVILAVYLLVVWGLYRLLFKLPDGLEKVEAPILIMTGEKDYKIIKKSANDLLMSIPGSVGYMAPNLGHAWNLEDPELFNLVLRRWITNGDLKDALLPMES